MDITNYQAMVIGSYSTAQELKSIFSNVIFVVNAKEALIELQSNYHPYSIKSTILIIDTNEENRSILMLRMIIQFLKNGLLENVIPLVSSSNDSPEYMMKCIDIGAAGYLLKPLRHNVLQTLFLYAHKYKPPSPCDLSCYKKLDKCWHHHKDRIKDIFSSEQHWVTQAIIDTHLPQHDKLRFDISKVSKQRKMELSHQLCQWEFSPFEYTDLDLIYSTWLIFDQVFQLPDLLSYKLHDDQFIEFIHDIWNACYKRNPYHSYYHAIDVLQAMYYCLCKMGLLKWIDESSTETLANSSSSSYKNIIQGIDILALLLACIGHDIGHPGVTNGFMINTSTSLSLLYNDQSVLENFHSMLLCHLIQQYWSIDIYKDKNIIAFRTKIIRAILSTDIALHQCYLDKIKKYQPSLISMIKNKQPALIDDDQKMALLNGFIKCVDISNIARPFPIAKIWAKRLVEELHQQGDIEKELGITSLLIHQRDKITLPDFQKQFIDQVGEGLFKTIIDIVPEMGFCLEIIKKNRSLWDQQ